MKNPDPNESYEQIWTMLWLLCMLQIAVIATLWLRM